MSGDNTEYISIIQPFLALLSDSNSFKKDKNRVAMLDSVNEDLSSGGIEKAVDFLISCTSFKNKDVRDSSLRTISELLSTPDRSFLLTYDQTLSLIDSLMAHIMAQKENEFTDTGSCLSYLLFGPNQKLYIKGKRLYDMVDFILQQYNKTVLPKVKSYVESLLPRLVRSVAADDHSGMDYRSIVKAAVDSLCGQSGQKASFVVEFIQMCVVTPIGNVQSTAGYKLVIMEDMPDFFKLALFESPQSLYEPSLKLFKQFIKLPLAVYSLPTVLDEVIVPALEEQSNRTLGACQFLDSIADQLLNVYSISDCNKDDERRPFEAVLQSLSKCIMDNPNRVVLSSLTSLLSQLRLSAIAFNKKPYFESANAIKSILEHKMVVEECARVFKKKGIDAILKAGLAEDSPESIASFLRSCALLDGQKVGDILAHPSNKDLLEAYLNTFDFRGMALDQAIRLLCANYSLPGESQMIDRVMSAFAKKYHTDNESISEDAAYVVSFSIIMLHTDLHNKNVSKKMKCDEWIKNTYNVAEAQEIPIDQLKEIYRRVSEHKMRLQGSSPRRERKMSDVDPSSDMLYVIIERQWLTCFACLSNYLQSLSNITQSSFEVQVAHQALEGLEHLGFFLANYEMPKELESVCNFLCQLCTSPYPPGLEEAQIDSINTIVRVAFTNGHLIGSSWTQILRLFSHLIRAAGQTLDMDAVTEESPVFSTRIIPDIPVAEIQNVYSESTTLKSTSFPSFIQALCDISFEETFENPPLLFSLQRLIEVIIANFERELQIWTQAWTIASAHLCRVGCLDHETIAMCVIDGVRQIIYRAMDDQNRWKTLQDTLITPLYVIFQNQILLNPRRFIIQCIQGFIRETEFTSSWDIILDILDIAAADCDMTIVSSAYQIIEKCHLNVPEGSHIKLIHALIKFSRQTVYTQANVTSIAFVLPIAIGIRPVTYDLLLSVMNALYTNNTEVVGYATNLYFILLCNYLDESPFEEIIKGCILPLFSTARPDIIVEVIDHFFGTFLETVGSKGAGAIVPVTSVVIKLGEHKVTHLLVQKLFAAATSSEKSVVEESVKSIVFLIDDMGSSTLESVLQLCSPSLVYAPLIESGCLRASKDLYPQTDRFVTLLFDLYKTYPRERAEGTADTVIHMLQNMLQIRSDQPTQHIMLIHCRSMEDTYAYLGDRVRELHYVMLQYFLHPSEPVRRIIHDISVTTLSLIVN